MLAVSVSPVKEVICDVLLVFELVLIARLIMSFFPLSTASPAQRSYRLVQHLTEPVLGPIRRVIPPVAGGWDFSIMIVFFLLYLVHAILGCPGVL